VHITFFNQLKFHFDWLCLQTGHKRWQFMQTKVPKGLPTPITRENVFSV